MVSRWLPTVLMILTLTAGGWGFWTLLHRTPEESDDGSDDSAKVELASSVTLPEQKLAVAGIQLTDAQTRMIGERRHVPGRIQYDDRHHVEVKASTPGILSEVRVKPGDSVIRGQVLAIVSSPEVGHARADVLKREAEYDLALKKQSWQQATCDGVKKLLESVRKGVAVKEISDSMTDIPVGQYRNDILAAYSRYLLAANVVESLQSAVSTGAVPGRTVQEKMSERDAAEAGLKAVMEQTLFDATQKCQAAQLEVEDVRRRLLISQQQVQTLLGYEEPSDQMDAGRPLAHVEIRAPFEGTIESRFYSAQERIEANSSLFVLADTAQLWVAADVREQEWQALQVSPGKTITITTPALGNSTFQATVYYIGREVMAASNAVPLVATIDNPDGLFRPGQFVEVELPLGPERSALVIPESAIVEHDGEKFVFIAAGNNTFNKVTVETGIDSHGMIEVTRGLKEHQQVVSSGAFYLKSELLLESESE